MPVKGKVEREQKSAVSVFLLLLSHPLYCSPFTCALFSNRHFCHGVPERFVPGAWSPSENSTASNQGLEDLPFSGRFALDT